MKGKLNNAQLEILSLFSEEMEKSSLDRLKKNLIEFRANELSNMIGTYLEKEGLTPEDILKEHMRTPYLPKNKRESSR